MVKVLQCHHFSGQKVLCPRTEPITAQVYKSKLFIQTKRPGIQIHDLGTDDSSSFVQIETTDVKQFDYVENQNALVTLESRKRMTDLHVFLYHVLDPSVGATSQSTKELTPGYHCKTPVTGFANPTCICADNQASNIGIGTKDHVYIYNIRKETVHNKPLTPCYDVKCLLEISVSIHVMRISLAEGFVLFGSETQVQVVQLYVNYDETCMLRDRSSENRSKNEEENDEPCSFVSSYMRDILLEETVSLRSHSRTSSSGSSVHSSFSFGSKDGTDKCQRVSDVRSSISLDKNHIYIVSEDGGEQNNNAVPVVWLKSIKTAHVQATSQSLRRDKIITGPVKNHPRCSVFINYIATTELPAGQERSIFTFLFREVDQSTVTHIELRPLYDPHAVSTSARSGGLQSENWQYLLGMLCYVSTHTEGYLYSLEPTGTQLLQTYQYSTQMIQLSLGLHHLYVATNVGVEIYTIDSLAYLLQKSKTAGNANKLCPRSREPCLIGLQPFFSLASISQDSNHVVVLSKVEGDQVWSIYALEKPSLTELCREMVSTAELHQSSSLGTYKYMLQQTYNYVKASILLDGSTAEEDNILSKVAFYLGKVNSSPPDDNWQLCVPYFNESRMNFSAILQQCVVDQSTSPGRGLLNYIDFMLFSKQHAESKKPQLPLEQTEAHLILNLFTRWRPQLLSAVIVCSTLKGYSTEFALAKLQNCSKLGIGHEFYSKTRDGLAAALLHLTLGQVTEAEASLTTLTQKDVVELCVENLHILLMEDDKDETKSLSPLAQLLRKHNSYTLIEIFTQCVQRGQVSISSLHVLLASDVSDVHFIQILESLACDNVNESLFCDIAKSLKDVYIKHLKSKQQGLHNAATLKYILPKRDGLFRDRYQWLSNVPPLQGNKALRKACQNVGQDRMVIRDDLSHDRGDSNTGKLCPCTLCNADLLKLQGLTCSSLVSEELLETVLSEIEGCNHLISVQLVCLLRTNPDRFAQVLFDTFPKLAAQIVKDFASAKNLSLVHAVTKYILEKQRVHQISEDKEAQKESTVYLKEVLHVLTEALSPEQLFQILPPDGNSRFFLRYIVRCLKLCQAAVVQENITKDAQTYLSKIMKA